MTGRYIRVAGNDTHAGSLSHNTHRTMILDQNSSLADLVEARRLSLRTKNACKARGITTLGQLLAVDPAELVTFRNFGARCSHEVETLRRELDEASSRGEKIYYGSPWDTRGFNSPIPAIERALSVVAETLGSVLYRRLRDMLSDYEHFAAMAYGEPARLYAAIGNGTPADNYALRKAVCHILRSWADDAADVAEKRLVEAAHDIFVERAPKSFLLESMNLLDERSHEMLSLKFDRAVAALSPRVRNRLPLLGNFRRLAPMILGLEPLPPGNGVLYGWGKKSVDELCAFFDRYAPVLQYDLERLTRPDGDTYRHQLESENIAVEFPFADQAQCEQALRLRASAPWYEAIYLLYYYMTGSQTRDIVWKCEFYGIGGKPRHTLGAIAAREGVSQERVRQVCTMPMKLAGGLERAARALLASVPGAVVVVSDTWVTSAIGCMDGVITPAELFGIVAALDGSHAVVDGVDGEPPFLIDVKLLASTRLIGNLSALRRQCGLQRRRATELRLAEWLTDSRGEPLGRDIALELMPAIESVIGAQAAFRRTSDPLVLMLEPNRVDRIPAIEEILRRKGRQMTLSELWEEYNAAFPDEPLATPASLKQFIYASKHIVPRGRTGRYVLDEWHEYFNGTIVDFLVSELEAADAPMPIDEAVRRARRHFPSTNANSILHLIDIDRDRRVITLSDNSLGLVGRDYGPVGLKVKRPMRRHGFDVHIRRLREFVEANGMMPSYSDNENQSALNRWIYNVMHGNIAVTDAQRAELENFIAAHADLPRSRRDITFGRKCDLLAAWVTEHGSLPGGGELLTFYRTHRATAPAFTGYRAQAWSRVEQALAATGHGAL